jgi:ethanolamine utilization protein EutA
MGATVHLLGLDFGTTTSSAAVAVAEMMRNHVTGRMELSQLRETYSSDIIFTPFTSDGLDLNELRKHLDSWMTAGKVSRDELFGGGALLTGLAAQQRNAGRLVQLVREYIGDAVIAAADDPRLESWLAFMAGAAGISRAHPDRYVINLDIGGGTTNVALGKAGNVLATGCWFVGARHVQVIPGSYRIAQLSPFAQELLAHLHIEKKPGRPLTPAEVEAVVAFYVDVLRSILTGNAARLGESIVRAHEQVAWRLPPDVVDPIVILSGGVGALVYANAQGEQWPTATQYGDLGIDFAQRLAAVPEWAEHWTRHIPAQAGRATLYGLLLYTTQVSGSTVFLPQPETLPLRDLPILGVVSLSIGEPQCLRLLDLVARSPAGGCIRAEIGQAPDDVRALGRMLAGALRRMNFPSGLPLVVLVRENVGKVLGQYITDWGRLPVQLVVIDEIAIRDAQFAQVGRVTDQVIPVSFYGMN